MTMVNTTARADGASISALSDRDPQGNPVVSFARTPETYRHWSIDIDGPVATLTMTVDEDGGLVPGYTLKLNSYDLGVDIELYDAVQRLRFEHPEVRAVVITGGLDKVFCAGANIRMLASSPHAWKVNFCKFTNETRNGIEDATAHSGQTYLAAVNGTASGGGYELALACEQILLVDDGSAAVSLPELPLLGVLPGTGGLTRIVDKRHVRRDLADVFATLPEGVRGETAARWRLIDESVPRNVFAQRVRECAERAAEGSARPAEATGITLTALARELTEDGVRYAHTRAVFDREERAVAITVSAPSTSDLPTLARLHEEGADFWSLAVVRELDDLILHLRSNELELGTWLLRTEGDIEQVLAHDQVLIDNPGDWLANEVLHYLKRTLKRLDVTSRSLFALLEPGSCFAGSLLELALAADRSYMLSGSFEDGDNDAPPPAIILTALNDGLLPMGNGLSRLATRFLGDDDAVRRIRERTGAAVEADDALDLGLVTFAPDDLDWEDEVRLAVEERANFSPDALTGLEANYRFAGPETVETKIFGRLTAWQNWIFNRPNASGPDGALRKFGTGQRATFDRKRV